MKVMFVKDVSEMSEINAKVLLIDSAGHWSGISSGTQQDGSVLIVLNATQAPNRLVATLMEEICHVLLGHRRNRISSDIAGAREYDLKIESEAYGVGAAALVPYHGLRLMLTQGFTLAAIARHFGVSESLAEYRVRLINVSGDCSV
ncbi:MAG: ImmA/IrrE family metallo-endopeptidase [Bacteroidetes bacterium]|nr:ImmA/IrrE family metallo-endopeptidase [Bacteroidota bacterium]